MSTVAAESHQHAGSPNKEGAIVTDEEMTYQRTPVNRGVVVIAVVVET